MRKVFALLLTVLLLGSLATMVFASDDDPSAVAVPKFTIEIHFDFETPVVETVVVEDGTEYTLTPKEKDGYEFEGYEISGEYEIKSKDGNTWVIIPKSDLVIHVKYKGVTPEPKPEDDKPVSPRTGVNTVLFAAMILVGLFGVVVATRKLVKTH